MNPSEPKSPTLLKPVVEFLNRNLRAEHPWSIVDEYPTVFTDRNLRNIQIIETQSQVISHAAIHPMIIRTPYAILKVGAIGSVVTDPSCRNQGMSRKIIENCIAQASKENCDFAILWTNLYDFYRKMGFELAGSEVSILWNRDMNIQPLFQRRFSNTNNVAAATLLNAYGKHTVGTVRTLADIQKYLNIPNTEIFTSWTSDHKLAAYAIMGKGADLADYVHEWGGAVDDLMALFNWIYTIKEKPLTVIAPHHSVNLIKQCEEKGISINRGYLGMIRLLNKPSFFKKVARRARTLGIADFDITADGSQFILTTDGHQVKLQSEAELIRLIFGPDKASMTINNPEVAERLEKVFPIEMWVWGWDSI